MGFVRPLVFGFPFVGCEADLVVTPLYGYFCKKKKKKKKVSVVDIFSHFSSSSAFLISLFTRPSHLSCCLPRFLHPSCFFVSDMFCKLSSFILTMCPAHFIPWECTNKLKKNKDVPVYFQFYYIAFIVQQNFGASRYIRCIPFAIHFALQRRWTLRSRRFGRSTSRNP